MKRKRKKNDPILWLFLVLIMSIFLIENYWKPMLIIGVIVLGLSRFVKYLKQKRDNHKLDILKIKYGTQNVNLAVLNDTVNKLLYYEKRKLSLVEKKDKQMLIKHYYTILHHLGSGYVYFVKEHGKYTVKIGKAVDPYDRIVKGFGIKIPYQLEVLFIIRTQNDLKTEQLFHQIFKNKRIYGEWFSLDQNDIDWVRSGDYSIEIYHSINGMKI